MKEIEEIIYNKLLDGVSDYGKWVVNEKANPEEIVRELNTLIQEKVKGFVKWNLKEDIKIQGSSLTLGASPEELLEARMERAERYLK